MGANWHPTTATRPGPANANVTLPQARRCELITKRVSHRTCPTPQYCERLKISFYRALAIEHLLRGRYEEAAMPGVALFNPAGP
jgi:hypothetical protein